MHTRSLIPKPKTTVIDLGVRLVHKQIMTRHYARLGCTVFSRTMVGKTYEHYIGKALHLAAYYSKL